MMRSLITVIARLLTVPRRLARTARSAQRGAKRSRPLWPATVFYESFGGNGALDNPEAIFRALIDDQEFAALRHVWALERGSGRAFRTEFSRHPRVRFVRPGSLRYSEALARCEYLVNNATFPPEFEKRPGQRYLNTWHGTPLKRMGYDMPDGAYDSANTLRNFVAADLLLSQNPHMTRMYTDAYRLEGILPGRILEAGYPRTDRQRLDAAERERAHDTLAASGIRVGTQKIVIYAPTWKGVDFGSPRAEADELLATARELQTRLGDDYLVLLKVHQAVHRGISGNTARGREAARLIPNELPTNVVLGIADVLVTDYSSIFIDFLSTGRPIVFYTPDRADYARERGTYFEADALPGATATTVTELADAILDPPVATAPITAVAQRWRRDFTAGDDGRATARAIDAFFRSRPDPSVIVPATAQRRPSVLIYLGGMRSNGITTSALNLLAHLDHDALEVSVLMARPSGREQRANAARIDSRVRQFHRRGGLGGQWLLTFAMRILGRLDPAHQERSWESQLWEDEWRRCLGETRFDTVIDFSGYSRFWAQLVLHSPAAHRLIWLHNDMAAEVNRPVAGRRRMRRSLPAVFALYPRFDGLVSVSTELAVCNAAALATRYGVPEERFLSARNVIDEEAARRMLARPLVDALEFRDPDSGEVTIPPWAQQLLEKRDGAARWFVTVGRLSTEKNQARLLDAFAIVHREQPRTRLIVIGDGPLRAALEARVSALCLAGSVTIAGALANPFAVLALADCFVLSSDYEGQPMVLLEAAVAGLPIVTVRFGSVADALPSGQMHIVEQSVDALAQGLRDYLSGSVAPATLDAAEYNTRALWEFEAALGSGSSSASEAVSSSIEREISARTDSAPRASAASTTTATTEMMTGHHMRASSVGDQPPTESILTSVISDTSQKPGFSSESSGD